MSYDKNRFAELSKAKADKQVELQSIGKELHAIEDKWQDADVPNADYNVVAHQHQTYMQQQAKHAQLTREIQLVDAELVNMNASTPKPKKPQIHDVFTRWIKKGNAGLDSDERNAFIEDTDDGNSMFSFKPQAVANTIQTDNASGEEAVEEYVIPTVVDRVKYWGGALQSISHYDFATGGDKKFLYGDDTDAIGEIRDDQGESATTDAPGNIGAVTLSPKDADSKYIKVTESMVMDAVFDVAAWVQNKAMIRMGRLWEQQVSVGDGAGNNSLGIIPGSTAGVTAASATVITMAELTSLIHSVEPAYHAMGDIVDMQGMPQGYTPTGTVNREPVCLLTSWTGMQLLRNLTANGYPLLIDPNQNVASASGMGVGSRIYGYPVKVAAEFPVVASGANVMAFGNFSYYGLASAGGRRFKRFQDSNTNGQPWFLVEERRQGKPIGGLTSATTTEAWKYLKMG